ncbi:MAG: class I SAM-dependent DNA methyltransferase [Planctomycetes bacterium]|nr:class I SAM-dependent DNA methyltransferase [Planctomycetota bacterium]
MTEEANALAEFVAYAGRLKGDERGEAQVFLEHLFQAFGHKSLAETGATLEMRVRKRGHTKFADLVWPARVLVEMKKRGERLERHYRQAFDYWVYLTPHRPRWVVLCNFDEFWIYDFDAQVEEPMEKLLLADLPRRAVALAFLKPEPEEPLFDVNRIEVTKEAADRVAQAFNSMVERGIDRDQAQRFVLQCVVAKFSEDLDLLPRNFFTRLLHECLESRDPSALAFDLISALFRQMNEPKRAKGGRFKEVDYFNGGLFATVDPVELTLEELEHLHAAAKEDWSKVNPAIFGTIFQHSMGDAARHTAGAHFTSEADILKVVNPTIVHPWRKRLDSAKTLKELLDLKRDLHKFQVLDPACGSGNFLYVAFRELRRLEMDLILRIRPFRKAKRVAGGDRVAVTQFHGMDILPFAVELAKVTLLLAKELSLAEEKREFAAHRKWLDFDAALPLDNLDKNIRCDDALLTEWPRADAIIGNPPYQSKNKMQAEYGRMYLNKLRAAFPKVPGRADYCVYFFRKAHDQLKAGGRAGLVGTNTITQNYSREGGLEHIVKTGGTISEAVSTQLWSGDAAVYVAIVNWVKGSVKGKRRLSSQSEDGDWTVHEVDSINASLSPKVDVTAAKTLEACSDGLYCAQGQTHGNESFLVTRQKAERLLNKDNKLSEVLFPFLTADELLSEDGGIPNRYVIDFHPKSVFEAQRYSALFSGIQEKVLPDREAAARREKQRNEEALSENPDARVNRHHANFLAKWWLLSYAREELMRELETLPRYIACGRVTKRPIFEFISTTIHPNDALQVFPLADDYSFGVLQSRQHWEWFIARCSTLKADFRYTSNTVFDTFPWPQNPKRKHVRAVASAAVALRQIRRKTMADQHLSLRDLYRIAEQPGVNAVKSAHATLDAAVADAYGMKPKADPLAFLLELNARCAAQEAEGEEITAPGLPPCVEDSSRFITEDCVRMPSGS